MPGTKGKDTMNKRGDYIERARVAHHEALKAMMPAGSTMTGKEVWRKLRRLECKASAMALRDCNTPVDSNEVELCYAQVEAAVERLFGRKLPGFFINRDPRGYALKLEERSVPFQLHQDLGGYQILAPIID